MRLGVLEIESQSVQDIRGALAKVSEKYFATHPEDKPYEDSFHEGLLLSALLDAIQRIESLERGRGKTDVVVVWGETPERDQEPAVYQFDCKQEANAFLIGVEEAQGRDGYAAFETVTQAKQYLEEEGV